MSQAGKTIYINTGGGYNNVELGTSEALPPKDNEITVHIKANSLNYHDFAVVSGIWGPTERRIPMADGAGEVIAIGNKVTEFAIGDYVVSTFFPSWINGEPLVDGFSTVPGDGVDGFAREFVTMPATSFTHAPKNWSHAEASTLTTAGLTAWRALMVDATLKLGDTVLVQGTGGVSIFALQFAKMAGAKVIATTSSNKKLEKLLAIGADHVINYQETPDWGETARELTNDLGVDHVIDVGGSTTLMQSMIASKIGGHIAVIGILTGLDANLSVVTASIKQLRLQGVLVGNRTQQQNMVTAINANGMHPVIDKNFALEDMVEAFKYQETNQHFGKICLDI